MNLFQIISKTELTEEIEQNLDANQLIRIEKKLWAAVKLNEELTTKDAILVINALKEHANEVKFVLGNLDFFNLFLNRVELLDSPIKHTLNKENVRDFLEKFGNDFLNQKCLLSISKNKFGVFPVLDKYKEYLPYALLDLITKDLNEKLILKTKQLYDGKDDENKYHFMGEFYDALNRFKDAETDKWIGALFNVAHDFYSDSENGEWSELMLAMLKNYEPEGVEKSEAIENEDETSGEIGQAEVSKQGHVPYESNTSWAWFILFALIPSLFFFWIIPSCNKTSNKRKVQESLNVYDYGQIDQQQALKTMSSVVFADMHLMGDDTKSSFSAYEYLPSQVTFFNYSINPLEVTNSPKKVKVTNKTRFDMVLMEIEDNYYVNSVYIPKGMSANYPLDTSNTFRFYTGEKLFGTFGEARDIPKTPFIQKLRKFEIMTPYQKVFFEQRFKFFSAITLTQNKGEYKVKSKGYYISAGRFLSQ